jgi:hypothetical protein
LLIVFVFETVRRPASVNSMPCERDCNRCRRSGLPGARQAHVRWRRLKACTSCYDCASCFVRRRRRQCRLIDRESARACF